MPEETHTSTLYLGLAWARLSPAELELCKHGNEGIQEMNWQVLIKSK